MPNVEISLAGPIFESTLPGELDQLSWSITDAIGDQGVIEVQVELDANLRHPTGYYRKHIQYRRQDGYGLVDDDKVIYGPWLEGVSRRNETTRFKGYANFRRATQALEAKATEIAESKIEALLGAGV